jgi:hypothetical protein
LGILLVVFIEEPQKYRLKADVHLDDFKEIHIPMSMHIGRLAHRCQGW